jgi:hypothetical protein
MYWVANNFPLLIVLVIIAGYIISTIKTYIGQKSKVIGRPYK